MKKEFIPYAQALALQELGFNEPCFGSWFNYEDKNIVVLLSENIDGWYDHYADNLQVSSPLYRQAFRWFREKYFLHSYITCSCTVNEILSYNWVIHKMMNSDTKEENFLTDYEQTSEQAELICLKKLIGIVTNK